MLLILLTQNISMRHARYILSHIADKPMIDDMISRSSVRSEGDLVFMLQQWKDNGFPNDMLDYMLPTYGDIIKEAIQYSYSPVLLEYLAQYANTASWSLTCIDHKVFWVKSQRESYTTLLSNCLSKEDASMIYKKTIEKRAPLLVEVLMKWNPLEMYRKFYKRESSKKKPIRWLSSISSWNPKSMSDYFKSQSEIKTFFELACIDPNTFL